MTKHERAKNKLLHLLCNNKKNLLTERTLCDIEVHNLCKADTNPLFKRWLKEWFEDVENFDWKVNTFHYENAKHYQQMIKLHVKKKVYPDRKKIYFRKLTNLYCLIIILF